MGVADLFSPIAGPDMAIKAIRNTTFGWLLLVPLYILAGFVMNPWAWGFAIILGVFALLVRYLGSRAAAVTLVVLFAADLFSSSLLETGPQRQPGLLLGLLVVATGARALLATIRLQRWRRQGAEIEVANRGAPRSSVLAPVAVAATLTLAPIGLMAAGLEAPWKAGEGAGMASESVDVKAARESAESVVAARESAESVWAARGAAESVAAARESAESVGATSEENGGGGDYLFYRAHYETSGTPGDGLRPAHGPGAAPDVQGGSGESRKGKPQKHYIPITLKSAHRYVGEWIELRLSDGSTVSARLEGVEVSVLRVERRMSMGMMAYPIPKSHIESMRVVRCARPSLVNPVS